MYQDLFHSVPRKVFVRLSAFFAVFLMCTIGFVALANEMLSGDTLQTDRAILTAINQRSSDELDVFFLRATDLGGIFATAVIAIVVFTMLIARRHFKHAVIVSAGIAGAGAINVILKLIFERARPDLWEHLVIETSFSFPSGHAMASSALAFCFVAIFWKSRFRGLVIAAAAFFILLIGLSRLYLGVHYPSDILAGWLVSGAWILSVVAITKGWNINRRFLRQRRQMG